MTNEVSNLEGAQSGSYGPNYRDHLLAQYSLYVEMADRISQRRQTANAFYLSINTLLVALISISLPDSLAEASWLWPVGVGIAGLVLSISWYVHIAAYRQLNAAKFQLVHRIEEYLPLRPYAAEWESVGRGSNSKLYRPLTHVERYVPCVFGCLFLGLAATHVVSVMTA